MSKIRDQAMRNLKSAGLNAATSGAKAADKAGTGLFRWMVTDHSGVDFHMPRGRGFFGTIWDLFMQIVMASLVSLVGAVMLYLVIAYGIPAFIFGHF